MTMVGGGVAVNDEGGEGKPNGSGLAWALFLAIRAGKDDELQSFRAQHDKDEARLKESVDKGIVPASRLAETIERNRQTRLQILRGWAKDANIYGKAIVAYLQAHATVSLSGVVATVAPATSLGTTPDPLAPGLPIVGPVAPVALPVTGDAGAVVLPVT